jgi:lipoprotein-releasing system permease protein
MLGTWLLIFVLSVSNGFEQEVKEQLVGRDAHFEIIKYRQEPIRNYDSLEAALQGDSEIVGLAPYITSQGVLAKKKNFRGVVLYGIDAQKSQKVIRLKSYIKRGTYQFQGLTDKKGKKRPGIILGYALANHLGLEVGDMCYLYVLGGEGLSGTLSPKVTTFIVSGIFESGMYEYDETLAYVDLTSAQKAFKMKGEVTGIQGVIQDPQKSIVFSERMQENLQYPFVVLDWQEKNKNLIKWIDYEKVLMGLALSIIVIIAAFNIVSSLIMNVNDKQREIGILRAMGMTKASILRIFMAEGCLIGVVGTTMGLILGLLSCWIQLKFGLIQLPGDVYFVTQLPILLEWQDVLFVLFVTNILCIIASIVPALKASRQNPVTAIHHE